MISSTGILVKRESTSHETSSYSFDIDAFFTKSENQQMLLDRFTKILQKMLQQDLTLQIMNWNAVPLKRYYQKEKLKK